MRCLDAEITCSQLTDRHINRAWGLNGGGEGTSGMTYFQADGTDDWKTMVEAFGKRSTSKWSNVVIKPGDRVHIITPGGGGAGDAAERNPERIKEDILEGYISPDKAQADYGYRTEGSD